MGRLRAGLLLCFCLAAVVQAQDAGPAEFKLTLGASAGTLSGKWRFHLGDDLAWAQPSLDDSKWETITADGPWGTQGHPGYAGYAWYRRAVEIDGVAGPVSIYVPQVDSAYEVYWNGEKIGGSGKLPPRAEWNNSPMSNVIALPDPKPDVGGRLAGVLAIRVWHAMLDSGASLDDGGLNGPPRIGDRKTLLDEHALAVDSHEMHNQIGLFEGALLMLVGMIAWGVWALDRSRKLYLWLGVFLVGQGGLSPSFFVLPTFVLVSFGGALCYSAIDLGLWMLVLVLFGLDQERGWRRATGVLATLYLIAQATDLAAICFWSSGWPPLRIVDRVTTTVLICLAPYLFILLAAGLRRRRDLALLPTVLSCALLETYLLLANALGQGVQFTGIRIQAIFDAARIGFGGFLLTLYNDLEALVLVTLVATVYREHLRERRRQVFVESELQSAHEVQSVLVPEETPAVPGFAISSLYWPAGEVGGDMFQVLPGEDGDVTVVLADVSGKGLKAAMTVSLLVGAARTLAEQTTDPMSILAGLNRRLMGRTNGGFATCLVLHISASGEVAMANAGHLAPFLNGEAMEMEGSLPLGISYDAEFSDGRFFLREGDELALYTDGVLEAQRSDGALFGFERAEALMRARPSVQEVAEAAKAFGQQDDITVLMIARIREDDSRERMSVDLRTVSA